MARGRKSSPVVPCSTSQAPDPPAQLSPGALAEWRRVVPVLEAGGAVHAVDLAVLVAYCETFVLWFELRGKVDVASVVVDGKLNPAARYSESLLKQLRGLVDQLGFTPASRKQILTGRGGATLEELLS